ncbi:hypothetical protein JW711_06430 [Candidatus Woesearchaeota archaeon]|nr:hypothetical protein [Candidatus Woesearchaeota archaeon]
MVNPTHIVIYTTRAKLEEKRNLKGCISAYWTFQHRPKGFCDTSDGLDKVVFAFDGAIRGYFDSSGGLSSTPLPDNAVQFDHHDWFELPNPIPQKAFQGFKYSKNVPGLDDAVAQVERKRKRESQAYMRNQAQRRN